MLRLLAHIGADYYLRKPAVMLCVQRCATSRRARSRNRSESCIGLAVRNRRDVAGTVRPLFCLFPPQPHPRPPSWPGLGAAAPPPNGEFAQTPDPRPPPITTAGRTP